MGVTRKQSTPNFPKNEHFLPPDTHTRELKAEKMCNTDFFSLGSSSKYSLHRNGRHCCPFHIC